MRAATGDGGEVGRGGHRQHGWGEVFGFDSIGHQLVQVGGVHVLVVVPPEAVKGDEQQRVPGCCLAQRLPCNTEQREDGDAELQLHGGGGGLGQLGTPCCPLLAAV